MWKIMKIASLCLVLILVIRIITHAKEWVFITISPDGRFSMYIDKDSIIYSDDKAWYWSIFEFVEPQESVKEGEFYSILYSFMEIDCTKKSYTNTYAIERKKNGDVVWKGHVPAKPNIPIPPDSLIQKQYDFVCIKLKP